MKFRPLFRLFRLCPELKKWAGFAAVLALAEAVSAPVVVHILRLMLDQIFQTNTGLYLPLGISVVLLILFRGAISWVRSQVLGRISEHGSAKLRDLAVESLLDMPVPRMDTIHTGDHLSRLTNDAGTIRRYLYFDLFWLISLPVEAVLSLGYLFYIDWIMTLSTLALIPLLMFLNAKTSAPVEKLSKELQENLTAVNNVTQDVLGGVEVVRAFNLQKAMEERLGNSLSGTVASGRKLARQKAWLRMAGVAAGFVPFFVPVGLGGWFTLTGRTTPGGILAFIQLTNSIANPLAMMPNSLGEHQKAMASLERLYELIDQPRERQDGGEFSNGQGVILEAENLAFGYDQEPILNGLSFQLKRGETVALVGPSGAGKSTVFKVLTGFYPPQSGRVTLYARPLEQWKLSAARRQMAVVSQDTFLFPGSVAENIALGRPEASREQIITAAMQANAHDFIQQMPGGYDHVLNERGANLSGGQRQRLAIARAILLDAPLLLLDEATSALDTESERLVQDALDAMAASRTTLVIAHRLSTIRNADRILVMEAGRIVETGTHQELLQQGGLYRQLYTKHLEADAEKGGAA